MAVYPFSRKRKAYVQLLNAAKKAKMYKNPRYSRALPSVNSGWRPGGRGSMVQEMNYVDVNSTGNLANLNGSVLLLNGMSYGTGASQHIGLKARLKSLEYEVTVINDTTALLQYVNVWFVYDLNPNGTLPPFSNIIQNGEFINLQNRDRYKIIKKCRFTLTGNATALQDNTIVRCNGYHKFDYDMVFNNGTTGGISDIQTGGIYMLAFSTVAAGTADANVNVVSRIRFVA